ncbi:MAG: hypothetical protein WDO72_13535 [Pseudomonadota bacterium]
MVLGLSLAAFTQLHTIISLIAIVTGLIALVAFARRTWAGSIMQIFVWTTVATTLTGFLFPFNGFTPAIGTGIVSSVVLVVLLFALYQSKLRGGARTVFAVTATISLYLNLFVLVVQSFLKIPALHALAPLGKEPPFAAAQGIVLLASIALGYFCVKAARRHT